MKKICFRFDIDTHKCLRDGVPNLLKLAKIYDIKFTFFINTGRSVDMLDYIFDRKKNDKNVENVKSLSAIKKLGFRDYCYVALRNPLIVESYPQVVKSIYINGHEIGLHGGKNHQLWHKTAQKWSSDKIEQEIMWGIVQLKNAVKSISPTGFASPGWTGSEKINSVLQKNGFQYCADIHTDKALQKIIIKNKIKRVPTNIAGEPGGVGYIEYCRVSGMNDDYILKDFVDKLKRREKLAVMYDHPYYVGVRELSLLKKMIEKAISMKYTFVTMDYIAKTL